MKQLLTFSRAHQDVQVTFNWRPLDIANPPSCSGVYAIVNKNMKQWYYIGKSANIAKRIIVKNHPVQVTRDIDLQQKYFYVQVPKIDIGWAERYLIKRIEPEWNGCTSFEGFSPWFHCDLPLYSGHPLEEEVLAAIEASCS